MGGIQPTFAGHNWAVNVSCDCSGRENARPNPPPAAATESLTHESGGCYPNDEWAICMNPGDDFCFSTGV